MFLTRIIEANECEPYTADDLADLVPAAKANGKNYFEAHKPLSSSSGASSLDSLNTAALANMAAWVPEIFPDAQPTAAGGYRVSSASLGRDLEEDLSLHPEGIKAFGIADQADPHEGRRTPIDIVIEYGKKDHGEAVTWLRERLGLQEASGVSLDDFRAYMPQHCYIFVPTREAWPASSVNNRIPPVLVVDTDGKPLLDEKEKKQYIAPSAWLDKNRPVEQMTWAPGMPGIIPDRLISEGGWIERSGVNCLNLYRPPTIEMGDASKAGPWIDHVRKVYPDDADAIIERLAHKVQHPEDKINHALVLGGSPGIGKDTLLEPAKHAVGSWNFIEISPHHVLGSFNSYNKSVILRMSEARDLGDVNRFQFYERMKVQTAAPPDVLRINEKHLREYYISNCCFVIITTNRKDSLYLPADDRRNYVAWSNLEKEEFDKDYWKKIWGYYKNGGTGHVAAYLATLDISAFDPKAPPLKTPVFWEIVNLNSAPEDDEFADTIDLLGNPKALTTEMMSDKVSANGARGSFYEYLTDRKNSRSLPHRLEQCGYVCVRNGSCKDGRWVINGARYVIYAKAELSIRDRHIAAEELVK